MTVDIVLPMRSLAQSFLCTDLVSSCEAYIYKNFEAVARTSSFFNLDGSELLELLDSDELRVSSEERLFHIVMSWVEYDMMKPKFSVDTNSVTSESVNLIEFSDSRNANLNSKRPFSANGNDFRTSYSSGSSPSLHHSLDLNTSQVFSNKPKIPRTEFLPCLLRRIRLPLIPVSFIFSVISRHELIRQDIRCR
ncbi:unnamed protein product [Trichobilharzia regenti]|nr:unnamed protein product [Trichobilharzia regenti]